MSDWLMTGGAIALLVLAALLASAADQRLIHRSIKPCSVCKTRQWIRRDCSYKRCQRVFCRACSEKHLKQWEQDDGHGYSLYFYSCKQHRGDPLFTDDFDAK
jgi:hypothetical protein